MLPSAQTTHLSIAPSLDETRLERYRLRLAQAPLFRGAPPALLDDLARRLQLRSRVAGQTVVNAADPGDAMFLIHAGRVRVLVSGESGREVILATLGPGDFFGEMALLDGRPRSATVMAMEDTTLLVLTREALLAHLRSHPQTALNLLAELSLRLRRADQTITELVLSDVHERLVKTLVRLARQDGEENEAGLVVHHRPTQQELANMVGSCRETVSRAFTSWTRRGLLVPRGRSLVVTRRLLSIHAGQSA